ncbi:MAG: hypothetical protein HC850_09995 [Rhodomicrobium sp.]|nr:hypothetical protein [Rhodomicrobium sp.]
MEDYEANRAGIASFIPASEADLLSDAKSPPPDARLFSSDEHLTVISADESIEETARRVVEILDCAG